MQSNNGWSHDNNGRHSQGVASGWGDRFGNGGSLPEPKNRGPKDAEIKRVEVDPEARILPGGYIPPDKRVTGKRFENLPKRVRDLTVLSNLVDEAIKEVSGGEDSGNGHVVDIDIDNVLRAMKARTNGAPVQGLTESAKLHAVWAAVAWRQHTKITS